MVEKRIINNINKSIQTSSNYKSIESRLDFGGLQSKVTPVLKFKRQLRFLTPLSIFSLFVLAAAIIVPVIVANNNAPQQANLTPVSDELMSFYSKGSSSINGQGEITQKESVNHLYGLYKNHPNDLALMAKFSKVFNLASENQLRCYYVSKEVYEKTNEAIQFCKSFWSARILPLRGLTGYTQARVQGFLNEELKNQQIMEIVLNSNYSTIDFIIDDYCLLDIVRLYNDTNSDGYTFVDFVDFNVEDNKVFIDNKDFKKSIKYLRCPPSELTNKTRYFSYLCSLDYHGLEIKKKDGIEVIENRFDYSHYYQSSDAHYYDDLNQCIIKKTLITESSSFDTFDVVFDSNKLFNLFGLFRGETNA